MSSPRAGERQSHDRLFPVGAHLRGPSFDRSVAVCLLGSYRSHSKREETQRVQYVFSQHTGFTPESKDKAPENNLCTSPNVMLPDPLTSFNKCSPFACKSDQLPSSTVAGM